jgi:putative PIG3 family NAD(P)H quinone oxidoreductase
MKAVCVIADSKLAWNEVPTPTPGAGEVLIKVQATAINRADLMQRMGMYPPPAGASEIMGLECAGIVASIGEGVTRWKEGDEVCALLAGGGYGEYATAPEGSVLPVPAGLSMVQAACLPEVFATAYLNMYIEANLKEGEKVILHAGASGVGTAGIQLAKAFGNPCFVTAGTDEKIQACLDLGAAAGVNRKTESFLDKATIFAGESGVDLILDPVGGGYLQDNLKLLGLGGRLVLIGLMGGLSSEIDLTQMLRKRLRVIGSTLRTRPVAEKAEIMGQLETRVWPKIVSGEIKPILDTVFPITDIEQAHELVSSDTTVGKVVLLIEAA